MKTRREIEAEAVQLELRGRQVWAERRTNTAGSPAAAAGPVNLFTFPDSIVTLNPSSLRETSETHRMTRRIDVELVTGEPEFKLIEEEVVTDADGRVVRTYGAIDLESADNALEVLEAGYQRIDEDLLRERIEPLAERIASDELREPVTAAAIAEVERATEGFEFSPAARMRLRIDAVALLEGRLEAGDFVARTVERQVCYETAVVATMSRPVTERIDVA